MPGNAVYTDSALGGRTVSFFNMHGDVIAVSNSAGTTVWEGRSDPHGGAITGDPANTATAGVSYGWHGAWGVVVVYYSYEAASAGAAYLDDPKNGCL